MLTLHLTLVLDGDADTDSATTLGEHFKDLIWKEAYETMRLPAQIATAYAERS